MRVGGLAHTIEARSLRRIERITEMRLKGTPIDAAET